MTAGRIVDDALVALVGAESESDIHGALAESVHQLLPGSYVVVHTLVEGTEDYRVAATAGLDAMLRPAARLLGFDPLATTYSLQRMDAEDVALYRTGRLARLPGGLYDLTLRQLPKAACATLERLAGIRGAYTMGFTWEGSHYGGASFCLRTDPQPDHVQAVETLVRVATVAIRRLRAESKLRAKSAEVDSFFSESLDLLCIVGLDGRFRRLNPEWERTLGFSVQELEGQPFMDFVHPDDADSTLEAFGRLTNGDSVVRFVNRYRTNDGGIRWLEWRAFPRSGAVYAAARDLTERIEAEQAIRESEARFRLIADNTADVIWMIDVAAMRITYVSPSVERLRGFTADQVLGQTVKDALTPDSFARVTASLPERISAVESGDESQRIRIDQVDQPCRDGSIVSTEVTTCMVSDVEGHVVEILGVSRDITERRLAETEIRTLNEQLEERVRERTVQLEEAVAELEAFSYSVSHDLRAPLRAINGYATIIATDHGEALGSDGRSLCGHIVANTRRMGQLIDDLLAFARLGRRRLAAEPVDMRALVDEVLALQLGDEGVRYRVGELAPAHGDPVLLRQVWVNLIDNAVRFSVGRATPTVDVECRLDADELVYSVRDNGVGFDMRYAGKLFQVFERLHPGTHGGSGIGLAIVRRSVEAHGGRVWAYGEPDSGATFFFALPFSEA